VGGVGASCPTLSQTRAASPDRRPVSLMTPGTRPGHAWSHMDYPFSLGSNQMLSGTQGSPRGPRHAACTASSGTYRNLAPASCDTPTTGTPCCRSPVGGGAGEVVDVIAGENRATGSRPIQAQLICPMIIQHAWGAYRSRSGTPGVGNADNDAAMPTQASPSATPAVTSLG
jgi:hypothetical protein